MFFDVDPEPPATFDNAIEVALLLKEKLDSLGLRSYVKTSGKKGLHILIPISREKSFTQTRAFAHTIGQHLTKETEIVVPNSLTQRNQAKSSSTTCRIPTAEQWFAPTA